ncbi:MAG: hypothetical protein ACQEW9_04795 [Bacteroidota bacterium]
MNPLRNLLYLGLCLVILLNVSCTDESTPEGGEVVFELSFSKDVDDPEALVSIIMFNFEGGLYKIDSGKSLKTDSFYVKKNQNVVFGIDGSNHWGCIPTTLKAIYRGNVIYQKDYQVGLDCEGVRFDIDAIITGNVIIPG